MRKWGISNQNRQNMIETAPNPGVILSVAKNLPKREKQYLHFFLGRFLATLRMTPRVGGEIQVIHGDLD